VETCHSIDHLDKNRRETSENVTVKTLKTNKNYDLLWKTFYKNGHN
jgi:hypothetical protein